MNKFYVSNAAGVTFEGRQKHIDKLAIKDGLVFIREPENQYDKNAVAIHDRHGNHVGYVSKGLAEEISEQIDNGIKFSVWVDGVYYVDNADCLGLKFGYEFE